MRTNRRLGAAGWALDHPWILVAVGILVWFCFWVAGTRQTEHHVRASFDNAFNLVPGLAISVDGIEVGKIADVEYTGGKAVVELGINDEKFWPLHQGTRVISRWGTTIGSGTRRLDVVPGPTTAPEIPEGGIIPTKDTQPAVDVDLVLNSLNKDVRTDLSSWMKGMNKTFTGSEVQLSKTLRTSDGALGAAGDLLADLAIDTNALRSLVTTGQKTVTTLGRRDQAVRNLVTVAASTFDTFARNTRGTQASISETAPTFRQAQTTLKRVDASLEGLDDLIVALEPGAQALRPLAAAARPAFADLRKTVPNAVQTFRTARTAAPRITKLLDVASPFMARGDNVFADLAPMLACVRPYAPELGGALIGGATSHGTYDIKRNRFINGADALLDGGDTPPQFGGREVKRKDGSTGIMQYGLRAMPQADSTSVNNVVDSQTLTDLGLLTYAMPRPPGYSAGKPWFIPECGYTKDSLDASKDPESVRNGYKAETE